MSGNGRFDLLAKRRRGRREMPLTQVGDARGWLLAKFEEGSASQLLIVNSMVCYYWFTLFRDPHQRPKSFRGKKPSRDLGDGIGCIVIYGVILGWFPERRIVACCQFW